MKCNPPKSMAYWFLIMCFWIIGTAIIGAVTRLTDSGLTMMSWDAVEFWWPSTASITEYYILYQNTDESAITAFTRQEFVPRFFWEWFHRNWGRALALISLGGLIYFAIRRQITWSVGPVVVAAPFLIGFQGALGFYMVYSGFETDMGVDHIRLSLHLGGAFVAFGLFYWTALKILIPRPDWAIPTGLWVWAFVVLCLTLLFGAFTAGLNAADASSSWPNFYPGQFAPNGLCEGENPWRVWCWFNTPRGVYFVHRNIAMLSALMVIIASIQTWRSTVNKRGRIIAAHGIGFVLLQVFLGIWLISIKSSIMNPTDLKLTIAVLHQLGALLLFAVCLTALFGRKTS